jgi:hypothetical protein
MAKKKKENPPLEVVLIECAFHLGKGVGDAKIKLEAFEWWTARYRETFEKQLQNPKAYWKRDKEKVLPLAVKLGKLAAVLAAPHPIDQNVAQRACYIVEQDPSCPPPHLLLGKYCA